MSLEDAEDIAEENDIDMSEANLEALLVMHDEVKRQRDVIAGLLGVEA